jgi:ribonuclease HI
MNYEIFTDGSCKGNPGPGGWAALIKNLDTGGEEILRGGKSKTTNNIMELTAVIRALSEFSGNTEDPPKIKIYSDSTYVVKGVTEWLPGWVKTKFVGKKNVDLWKQYLTVSDGLDVSFQWVKAHNGHSENELVDSIACTESSKY